MTPTWPGMPYFMHRAASPPPASSVYSPTHLAHGNNNAGYGDANNAQPRSAALRPWSQLFSRFTPRLGAQRTGGGGSGDLEANPGHVHNSLYDSSTRHRSMASTHLPPQQQNPFADQTAHPAMPFHSSGIDDSTVQPPAAARTGPANDHQYDSGIPVTFTSDEIAHPAAAADGQSKKQKQHQSRRKKPSHRRAHHHHHHQHTASSLPPGHKSGSTSSLQDPAVKTKLLHTGISGLLFLGILIVFLAISPTTPVFSAPFRVVNSLLIVVFAILFVHCCIRLNTLIRAARRRRRRIARKNAKADAAAATAFGSVDSNDPTTAAAAPGGHNGMAMPPPPRAPYFDDPEIGLPPPGEPFRVVLARDEELGLTDDVHQPTDRQAHGLSHHDSDQYHPDGEVLDDDHRPVLGSSAAAAAAGRQVRDGEEGESEDEYRPRQRRPSVKMPPPVYGVWRGSVRADPNLLHWQRVPGAVAASSVDADSEGEDGARLGSGGGNGTRRGAGPPPPSYRTEEEQRRGHAEGLTMLPSTRYLI